MAMMRIGKVRGLQGPPGPGYTNAVELESAVRAIQAEFPSIAKKANNAVAKDMVGANNGVAALDTNGKVPASQLPSFIDDVSEYMNFASFPQEGESGKIYVAKNTNKTYRWSGSSYVIIGGDLALGETPSTAYAGDKGKENADNISILQDLVSQASNTLAGVSSTVNNLTRDKINGSEKAQPNGVPTLDENGKVPQSQLPAMVGGGSINAFGFEVRPDGCLWMVAQDGTTIPEAWVDEDGELHIRFDN
jgi:hypothetical protein